MKTASNNSRRSFLISCAGVSSAALTVSVSGCQKSAADGRQLQFGSLAEAEEKLAQLAQAKELISGTAWNWAQTLIHCAQSIEYSMTGFPQPKSELFQRTVGSAALTVFSWCGQMTHDLADPIPGAPILASNAEATQALLRLRGAILQFQQWSAPLKPHFAYGALSKSEYELAHAMHIANHISMFRAKA
jgi:hypothetical protein